MLQADNGSPVWNRQGTTVGADIGNIQVHATYTEYNRPCRKI